MTRALLVCLIAASFPVTAGGSLAIVVSPTVAREPAVLTVRTTIEPNAGNRTLEITAESADFYRGSTIPLDGANAPRHGIVEFRDLPNGTYEVKGVLISATGRTAVSRVFHVAPAAGSDR